MSGATLHAGYTVSPAQQLQQGAPQQCHTHALVHKTGQPRPDRPSESWLNQRRERPDTAEDLGQRLDDAVALPVPTGHDKYEGQDAAAAATPGGNARILQRGVSAPAPGRSHHLHRGRET